MTGGGPGRYFCLDIFRFVSRALVPVSVTVYHLKLSVSTIRLGSSP